MSNTRAENNGKGSLILLAAAFLWGFSFVAQNELSALPPLLINCLRSIVGAAFLGILWMIRNRAKKEPLFGKTPTERRTVLTGGAVCGAILAVSVGLQQFAFSLYPAGAAAEAHTGFLTALYVVFVPLLSTLFGRKPKPILWAAVALSLVGFYLLCLADGFSSFYAGDLPALLCAVTFTFHILAVDRFVKAVGGVRLSLLQFSFCALFSGIFSLLFEKPPVLSQLTAGLPWILYLGVGSCGIAYTLQIIGQRYAEPPVASLAMSLESVFAALGGWFVGNVLSFGDPRNLSGRETVGCILVFTAVLCAQIPDLLSLKRGQNESGRS